MNIESVMYGWDRIDFIADSATEEDIGGLMKLMADVGINAEKSRKKGSIEFKLDRSAGEILLSSDIDKIRSHIKIAMLPYQRLLFQPDYVVAEIRGQEHMAKMLESCSCPTIIVLSENQLKEFEKRFPGHAAKVQSTYEAQLSVELLKRIVPELRY